MQDYYSTHGLEKAVTYLVAGLLFLMVILLPFDTYEFLNNPKDYINVHHLDTTQELWQLQYLKNALIGFPLCLAGLIIILKSYSNKGNIPLKAVRRLVVFTTISLMVYGFYQSYLTGFDH